MSLNLFLDKSTLQSLSRVEAQFLGKHYRLNVPPVLLFEIIGDLAKESDGQRPAWLSQLFSPPSAIINLDYRDLLANSLLGADVPMTGQILMRLDEETFDPNRGRILFSDEPPAEAALRRWRAGNFNEAERVDPNSGKV